ncbi:hypothetical protein DOT_1007 [Desulfosporosinus sp. OT]|nr:hypothetical protein DOT_1007 [Desulfosporosinus sp. OT]
MGNKENPASPSLSEGETVGYTYATDEDTVFARISLLAVCNEVILSDKHKKNP